MKNQIKEMAKSMCEISRRSYELCGDCFGEKDNYIGCKGIAEHLYEKCIKKESEFAKDILEQFIAEIVNLRLVHTKDDLYDELLETKDYFLSIKYGVK